MLSTFNIQNFKCFIDQDIEFRKLTILAGANSVGKSTVIQSLLLAKMSLRTEKNIELNDVYRLNLGNTQEVLNRDANENFIKLKLENFFSLSDYIKIQIFLEVPKSIDSYHLIVQSIELPEQYKNRNVKITNPPHFSNLYYLNAERIGPRLSSQISTQEYLHVGYSGEFTMQVLEKIAEDKIDKEKAFDEIDKDLRYRTQVQLWMNFIIPGVEVNIPKLYEKVRTLEMTFGQSSPTNVGFGISYVLPIVLNGLLAEKNSLFIVENPEAHLHPFGQSRIGQFLAKISASGVQVVIETHSEHVINGIRIASIEGIISNEEVLINFFSKEEGNKQPKIEKIEINQMGDLTKFPFGFFDQSIHDTTTIIKARRAKKNTLI